MIVVAVLPMIISTICVKNDITRIPNDSETPKKLRGGDAGEPATEANGS